MSDDRKSGAALIIGSLGGILSLAIHPRGASSLPMAGPAHSLALISVVVLFLGACGLSRRVAGADRVSFAAIVTYAFACVAVFIAGAINGFAIPNVMTHMTRDVPAAAPQWHMVISGLFQLNQSLSRIFSVGGSAAIILWSISGMRTLMLARGTAIYGCVIGVLIIIGIGIGHLQLDIHGLTIVALAQIIWFLLVAFQLCRRPGTIAR